MLAQDKKRPELAPLKARIQSVADEFARHEELWEPLDATRALPPREYEDAEWTVLKSLLLVLRLAAAELKFVFAERKAADYPEFAAAARQALGTAEEPTDTALALDARLRHVLVDEFQDTSEAQVQLLRSLTAGWERGDGRTVFLVGDPMQSIYRFRNAEVGLFLDVRDRGLGDIELEPLTLRVNFRSTQPIVQWVNQAFARVLPPRDDVLRGAVKYSESVATPQATGRRRARPRLPAQQPAVRGPDGRRTSSSGVTLKRPTRASRSSCRGAATCSTSWSNSRGAASASRRPTSIRSARVRPCSTCWR